jgi:predicted Zn-dependent protease
MQLWYRRLAILIVLSVFMDLAGCQGAMDTGASLLTASGLVSQDIASSGAKSLQQLSKATEEFTPEQEYYLGRAVAATILSRYAPYDNPALTQYVNLIGQTLSQASDRPETFGGYHFLVLNSDEINAFAAPGGLIFLSRGMLRLCQSEDELAAVLAHEIGHVQAQHGIKSIQTKRRTAALAMIAMTGANVAANQLVGHQLASLTTLFEDSITDITSTLFEKGYSRSAEGQADLAAVEILTRVGYDPHALARVLTTLQSHVQTDQPGFTRSHPAPADRIAKIQAVSGDQAYVSVAARAERFRHALAAI